MNSVQIIVGDCLDVLRTMPDESVQCVVTSPPYWGLRDYGVAGQLGLEPTPELYVASLVNVFRAVRRVLRDDGTVWLNIGDCYVAKPNGNKHTRSSTLTTRRDGTRKRDVAETGRLGRSGNNGNGASDIAAAPHRGEIEGLKPKDLVGIPWRVAFALQADGWFLRTDVIWDKPSVMPESVTDRPTRSHEYVFLLSKCARYHYDAAAIAEPAEYAESGRASRKRGEFAGKTNALAGRESFRAVTQIRNKRTVWTVASQPYAGAHFATMPPKLVEPCILAGCPKGGTVLDPFAGAGTVGLVASRLGRSFIGIELNPKYAEMARNRIHADAPLFSTAGESAG